ncbi:MAG: helix-turn-helix domain-containing protein [Solirubrobacteraceae bacterium]
MKGAASAVGERIKRAREAASISQATLAELLGKQQTAISHWESGRRLPGIDDLVNLAEALGVAPADLLPDTEPARRSGAVLLRAVMDALESDTLKGSLERFIARAEAQAPLPIVVRVPQDRPERAARALLARADEHGLDVSHTHQPLDMDALAQLCGVRVLYEKFEDGLSGLLVMLDNGPAIGVNKLHPNGRKRFTVAHELGHFVLGHYDRFHLDVPSAEAGESPYYDWRLERAANQFAADLLMPAGLVEQQVGRGSSPRQLAETFGVSEVAMGYRLINLGLAQP